MTGHTRPRSSEIDTLALDEFGPLPVPLGERIRRLPGAVLLTIGFYASRVPWVSRRP